MGALLLFILLSQLIAGWGEWYALHLYPLISTVLSSFSSLFPFSLGDIFIFLSLAGIIVYPVFGLINRLPWKKLLLRVGEYLVWIYIWFYMAWGMNYFRDNFYARMDIPRANYSAENFKTFLDDYITKLNESYTPVKWVEKSIVDDEIKKGYQHIHTRFGMTAPRGWQRPKTMLFSSLFSKFAITGYIGPFFCEYNLNGDLLPSQYPSTYAHEMAHILGISSEAEANLYAYLACKDSSVKEIRFSGYMSLFSHILRNASGFLSEEEYRNTISKINPEVVRLYEEKRVYWSEKYSPFIGDIQDKIYDWFLKGNNISSGRSNYSEVVGLLMSLTFSAEE